MPPLYSPKYRKNTVAPAGAVYSTGLYKMMSHLLDLYSTVLSSLRRKKLTVSPKRLNTQRAGPTRLLHGLAVANFDIPVDRYGGVHSLLQCAATKLASRKILVEQKIKKRTGPAHCVLSFQGCTCCTYTVCNEIMSRAWQLYSTKCSKKPRCTCSNSTAQSYDTRRAVAPAVVAQYKVLHNILLQLLKLDSTQYCAKFCSCSCTEHRTLGNAFGPLIV